jgi:hypothetical protein
MSPVLFNLVVDVFTRRMIKAESSNLIRGLCPQPYPCGIISLQYADDTILFIENDVEVARNLKWVLTCFEQVSWMKINYEKSELVPINLDQVETELIKEVMGCVVGAFPIKYLGIPLHHDKLRREDLQPLIDKILNRIAG